MAKPEWGTKRVCPDCGSKFYDLRRDPIVCPSCQSRFDSETLGKVRRPKAAEKEVAKPVEPAAQEPETEEVEGGEEEQGEETSAAANKGQGGDEEEGYEDVIEDASELGADEDLSEVIGEEDEDER